ncbi:penicillin-binding protein [bacterium]|nr:MAG: penicillin-binding protein [bacterium]
MKLYNFSTSPREPSKPKKDWKFKDLFSRKGWKKLPWSTIGTWTFRIGAAGVLFIAFLFIYYSRQLPDPNRLLGRNVPESTKIYAKDESLIYEVHGEIKRTLVNLDQISPDLKNATIAAEDKNFYKHSGISITGLARSVIVDIIYREKRQGGSTITQQFVKNAILTRDKSFIRKGKEIIIAIEMEARFSKDEILKMYLNEIPYGRNAYGIEAASLTYFNKHANELTLAQSAYLAALPQAPSYYNPSGPNFDDLQARQRYILAQMEELKYITAEQKEAALNEEVKFETIKTAIVAPHFVQYVENYLAEKYGETSLQEGGMKVYTTLDPKLQEIAEKAVAEGAKKNLASNGHNAALVAIDPKTGQILAMVGSKDYFGESEPAGCIQGKTCLFEPNVNVATSLQQPGSSFKPYAYVTAFGRDFKYSPASMLLDVKTNFGDYSPNNFNFSQNGPVSMRKALAGSLNIPAVKTIALVGADNVVKTAKDLGIDAPFKDCGLSLVLGGCDVKLLDHTAAYGVLANSGKKVEKTAILKVLSQEGEILEEYKEKSSQVLDPQAVYEVVNIMSDNNARSYVFGASSALTLGASRPVAAKTGTTQEIRDGWTVGFTPSLVAGVWTGNNNNAPMKRDAVLTAGPIWNQFMREALAGTPVEQFNKPEQIKTITVDSVSGLLPTQHTPETKSEIFADYAVPTKYDNVHVPVEIDSLTGLPATDDTPADRRITEIYTVLHSEKPNNAAWEQPVIAWALANGYKYPPGSGIENTNEGNSDKVAFLTPQGGSTITKLPFTVSLGVEGEFTKIDILIDGENAATFGKGTTQGPINKKVSDGNHTLTARVTFSNGSTASSSIQIKYAIDGGLTLTNPSEGDSVSFPLELEAQSSSNLSGVNFYYQTGNSTKNIGAADVINSQGDYYYTLTWSSQPKSGTYIVYARSSNGTTSNKITIQID